MIETKNTEKALSELRIFTDKPVTVRPISEMLLPGWNKPPKYLGGAVETDDEITIWLSDKCPEESFIHEVLHCILRHEGYPEISINEDYVNRKIHSEYWEDLPRLQGYFSSTITHPEVFRRMESEFSINFDRYYNLQMMQKLDRFKKMKNDNISENLHPYVMQQCILDSLDYFLWGDYGQKLLSEFQSMFPGAYQSCIALFNKVNKVGFSHPKKVQDSATIIKQHLIKYGERKGLDRKISNLWKALDIIILIKQKTFSKSN